ncbi:MAG TPA: response regulator [Longimicrobiales bacterium]|nr:response regulator [Longimicrobiales bacterium]
MSRGTVLVAEDAVLVRQRYGEMLRALDCTPLEAANGEEAVELARTGHPDLILMDLRMPVMDGWTAKDRLRQDPRTAAIPILAVTAVTLEAGEAAFMAHGFDGYARKPIGPYEMIEIVREWLDDRRREADAATA